MSCLPSCFSCWRRRDKSPRSMRNRSDSDATRKFFQPLIEQEGSVLNRGLGALSVPKLHSNTSSTWCSPAGCVILLGAMITFPCAIWIEMRHARLNTGSLFQSDPGARAAGLSRLAAIPFACGALNYLIQHIRRTTFWWKQSGEGSEGVSCCGFDKLATWPMTLVALGLVRSACLKMLSERPSAHVSYYLEIIIALLLLSLFYALLDQIDAIIKGMGKEQEEINKAKPVKKMQELVRNVSRSGRDLKDVVYCFAHTNTVPAVVLSYIWWIYYAVGKVLGAGITIGILIGVDSSTMSQSLLYGVFVSAITASGFVFELGPNALSLFRLSLNKPFYVGDLVTLNTNGAMDTSETSIMGFVENITMMYVVIRNFEMKQTWIPHNTFSKMIIQNWTRRPTKTVLLNIAISCRCPVKKVQQLTAFAKKWIQASEEIQQTNYQKFHITKTGNGYNLQIIFFPCVGVTHRGIRQKFLIAFMAASERLQVPFVPLQIQQNFCDEQATCPHDVETGLPDDDGDDFNDLMPDPADKLPKGVGNGFREFPKSQPDLPQMVSNL